MDTHQLEIDLLESTATTEVDLDEHFPEGLALREAEVDRDQGIIRNMTIMNRTSLNGHRYSDLGLEDAVKKFNGARFYIDHPTKSEMRDRNGVRSIRDLAGKVTNTRKVGDSVRADIQLLNLKGMRAMVFALAEQMPELAGNSIRATGIGRKDSTGQFVVDGFKDATSVDLVTTPAGTRGFFESFNGTGDMQTLTLESLQADHPDLVNEILSAHGIILEEASRLGSFIRRALGEKDMEVEELASKIGIAPGTMSAILSGEIARPPDARLRRIASTLGVSFESLRKLVGDEQSGGPGSLPIKKKVGDSMNITMTDYENVVAERDDLAKKLDEAKALVALRDRKDLVTTKLEAAKLPKAVVTDLFTKQLEDADDEKAIDALIEDRKGLGKRVKSGPRSTEREVVDGRTGEYTEIEDSKIGDYAIALGVR